MLSAAVGAGGRTDAAGGRNGPIPTAGTWSSVFQSNPGGECGVMMLLSDGSVMVQSGGGAAFQWYKLTPDSTGSYQNGSWSPMASMIDGRRYFGSNVLPDGRVFVIGGEYGPGTSQAINRGEIYSPVTNTWSHTADFPQAKFGDDPTQVLPNGTVLAGYILGNQTYVYSPGSNTWTQTGSKLHNDRSDEETWMELPDQSVLSYDVFGSAGGTTHAQRYVPGLGQWVEAGSPPAVMSNDTVGYEMGPALLLPDGRALEVGALPHNAYYLPWLNTWQTAPSLPGNYVSADGPGAVLPNGNVLIAGSPQGGLVTDQDGTHYNFPGSSKLWEFNPDFGQYTEVTDSQFADNNSAFEFMLDLPNGQVLMSDYNAGLRLYTPVGGPQQSWKPTISSITSLGGGSFLMSGKQLNGMSEGASYGDDAEMSENYPIVRYQDGFGHTTYARTHDWTSTGVQTGNTNVSTLFDIGGNGSGARLFTVSAAGISSDPALYITGTSGSDNIQIGSSGSNITVKFNGGATQTFAASAVTQIVVDGGDSADIIQVDGNLNVPTTVRGGNGDDVIYVGLGTQDLSGVTGNVSVQGGSGNDSITLYDNNNTGDNTYTVDNAHVQRAGLGSVSYDNAIENLTLFTSRGTGAVNIPSTAATAITTVTNGGGNYTFNVNGPTGLQSINGNLRLQSLSGATQINLNDAGDFVNRNVTLAQVDSDHGYIFGVAPANISYQYSFTSNLTFTAGGGADNVQVYATGAPTTISNDQTDDKVFVGDGTNGVQAIRGALTVTNPVDDTTLFISDAADSTEREFVLDNDGTFATLAGLAPAPIKWNMLDVQNVNITSGSALDVFNIRRNQYNLNYDGYGGYDNIYIGSGSGVGLQGITGTVTLTNTNLYNFLQFNDDEDTTGRNISVTNVNVGGADYQQATGLIPGTVRYKVADTAGVSYYIGKGNDTFTVPSTNLPLTIGSAGGSDSLIVGNGTLQGIVAPVTVNAYVAPLALTLDDSTDTTGRTVTHDLATSGSTSLGQFTGIAPAVIQYFQPAVSKITLKLGTGTDTVNVNETFSSVPLIVRASAGLDTVNVNTDNAGTALVSFDDSQNLAALNIGTGGRATITTNGNNLLETRALLLAAGATLDLLNNDLALDYTSASPIASVQSLINAARTNGTWTGSGITSSAAKNANPHITTLGVMEASDYRAIYGANSTFDGRPIATKAVLVKYTYYGDANFSGTVTFDDYVKIDTGFNQHRSGWSNGDFNGDGTVNFDDYVLIDTAFNTQAGTLGRAPQAGKASIKV